MSLLSSISKNLLIQPPSLSNLVILEKKKNAILNRWPDIVVLPNEKDRELIVQEIKRRYENDVWDDTPMSLVTRGALALFDEERRERDDLYELRNFYYTEIKSSTRRSFLNSLFLVYLSTYQLKADHTYKLASALARSWSHIGPIGQLLSSNIPQILDPSAAPEAIASKMGGMQDCWTELKALGLRSPHSPGVMDYAHLIFVENLKPNLHKRNIIEKLFSWLKPDGLKAKVSGAAVSITAILDPWINKDPSKEDLTFITENLLGLYGDPREIGGGVWTGVPETHLSVLERWLVGENIRFFLDVVSAVEESHMWAPRRAFWLSLHEQQRIDKAWVAFSHFGARYANKLLNSRNSRGSLSFGHQIAGGNRADTSLLILQIGNKIVVEGSHSYKVHIFKSSNPKAPALYQREYNCDYIRMINDSETRAHNGDWQGWVEERI